MCDFCCIRAFPPNCAVSRREKENVLVAVLFGFPLQFNHLRHWNDPITDCIPKVIQKFRLIASKDDALRSGLLVLPHQFFDLIDRAKLVNECLKLKRECSHRRRKRQMSN